MSKVNRSSGLEQKYSYCSVRRLARQAFFPRKTPTDPNFTHYTNCTFALDAAIGDAVPHARGACREWRACESEVPVTPKERQSRGSFWIYNLSSQLCRNRMELQPSPGL